MRKDDKHVINNLNATQDILIINRIKGTLGKGLRLWGGNWENKLIIVKYLINSSECYFFI